jgi:hypothetical protein
VAGKPEGQQPESAGDADEVWRLAEKFPEYEADLNRRFPVLAKPGPQPWNSDVAPTLMEQYAKVFQPRPARPLSPEEAQRIIATIRAFREEFRTALLDLLAEDIGAIVRLVLERQGNAHGQ